ncbi:hypothetical protein ACHAXN_007030 [Cyclotella atomus]
MYSFGATTLQSGSSKMSKAVVHQAFLFVGAFYITWVPYLILQCMLSSGKVTVVWAGPCGKHDVFPAGLLELHCLRSST